MKIEFLENQLNIEKIFKTIGLFFSLVTILIFFVQNFNSFNFNIFLNDLIYSYILTFSLFSSFALISNINEKKQIQFITIFNLLFLIFYLFKIFYIILDSKILIDYIKNYQDFNKYLLLLNLQYLFVSFVIINFFKNTSFSLDEINNSTYFKKKKFFFYILLVFCILVYFLIKILVDKYLFWNFSLLNIFLKIFDVDILILVLCILFFSNKTNFLNEKIIFIVLVLSYILFGLFVLGSKSNLLQIILNIILILILFRRIYVLKYVNYFYLFVISFFSILFFSFGSALRKFFIIETSQLCEGNSALHCYPVPKSFKLFIEYYKNFSLNLETGQFSYIVYMKDLFFGFFNRISYLDFYLFNMSNSEIISNNFNLLYYFKSSVDRLSVGFDLYNTPLLKNKLYEVLHGTQYGEIARMTNSSQITFFAENNIIFNLYFFPYILLFIFIFKNLKKIIFSFFSKVIFTKLLSLILLYQIFWLWITGFGLDILIVKFFYLTIFLYFFYFLEKFYEKKN